MLTAINSDYSIFGSGIHWFGVQHSPIKKQLQLAHADKPISHDNLFHSLLGLLGVETSAYLPEKDVLNSAL